MAELNSKNNIFDIDLSKVSKPQFNYSVPSDNTLVNTPIYRGEVKKEQRFVPRQTYISADNRTNWQKELGQKEATKAAKLEDLAKILEKGLNTLGALGTFYSPSTWVGPAIRMAVDSDYKNNGQDYSDRVLSGEGTGNAVGNLITDVVAFGLPGSVRRLLNSSKNIDYSKVIGQLNKEVKFKDFDFEYKINQDPFSKEALPISNDVKIDHAFGKNYRYKDYGTVPLYENIGSDIPNYVKRARDFYNKDVQWRENKDKINIFKLDPFRFYRTYNNKAPILVRDYLDKTPFGGYANSANNSLVIVKNTEFDPFETLIHEGAHRDLFRALNKNRINNPLENIKNTAEYIAYRNNPYLNFRLNPSRKAYSPEELYYLDNAYLFLPRYLKRNNIDDILEKGATNRELRAFISSKFGNKYGSELDQVIDNLPEDDLLYWLRLSNGYGRSFINLARNLGIPRNIQADRIKKALKFVPAVSPLIVTLNNEK